MTREEAIEILEEVKELDDSIYQYNTKYLKALNMAIHSLEQEPCEDAISRQAVLEYIEGSGAELGHDSENELVRHDIKELPPVIPQSKIGHWNRVTDKTEHLVWECDKCGWQQRFNTNYCPDCGAKMKEVKE